VAWDPSQYLQYAGERLRPAVDLLARVPLECPRAVIDLGCGAGNVTRLLAERWPDASITGVDNDAAMLARARSALDDPRVAFVAGDLATWTPPAPVDLVYSNAALHWIGDHDRVFARLAGMLAPAGVLAVQMPRNFGEPSHRAVADLATSGRWRGLLGALVRKAPVDGPETYLRRLAPLCASVDVWETIYLQRLAAREDGEHPVVAFVSGTWLVPYFAALGDARAAFLDDYRALIERAYAREVDGSALFPFRRLFIVATARA